MGIFEFLLKMFGRDSAVSIQSLGNYLLNDPSTPELSEPVVVPKKPGVLKFSVLGYDINSQSLVAKRAVNCQITLCKTINHFADVLHGLNIPVTRWAAVSNLAVMPAAGKDLNAYYDRRYLKFFYAPDSTLKKTVYTCESADVVSHEAGHAFLDILRPDFWNTQALEIWAFHEAFGDINAVATSISSDVMVKQALAEVSGDLMKSNVISRMAEELGKAVYTLDPNGRSPNYLRDVSVIFKYADPHTIPHDTLDSQLSSECHNFSRVFSGAWYEIVVRIYEKCKETMEPMAALKHARDVAYSYLIQAIKMSPRTVKYFDAVAKCMLTVDANNGHLYGSIIDSVFSKRHILLQQVKILSNLSLEDARENMKLTDTMLEMGAYTAITKAGVKTLKISDHLMVDLATNPLYGVDLEVPTEKSLLFKDGVLVDELSADNEEVLKSAVICTLAVNNYQGLGKNKPWKIENNKLIRNHIICCKS